MHYTSFHLSSCRILWSWHHNAVNKYTVPALPFWGAFCILQLGDAMYRLSQNRCSVILSLSWTVYCVPDRTVTYSAICRVSQSSVAMSVTLITLSYLLWEKKPWKYIIFFSNSEGRKNNSIGRCKVIQHTPSFSLALQQSAHHCLVEDIIHYWIKQLYTWPNSRAAVGDEEETCDLWCYKVYYDFNEKETLLVGKYTLISLIRG